MGYNNFAKFPSISLPRSKYKMPYKCATTFLHGQLIPLHCFLVYPGDTFSLKLSSIIRMSTPIAPIMDNIEAHVHAYFVPWRLIWDSTETFFGENKSTAGPNLNMPKIPMAQMSSAGLNGVTACSLSHYLGKPINSTGAWISMLKERGYYSIWNDHYRAQQVQPPVIISKLGNGKVNAAIGTYNGVSLKFDSAPFNVNKKFDYFTAATLAPQYGASVTLPLGTYAPITMKNESSTYQLPDNSTLAFQYVANDGDDLPAGKYANEIVGGTGTLTYGDLKWFNSSSQTAGKLYADLSNATAATINSIRYAFAAQRYLEACNYGTRYFEILSAHYGVTSPDARLQRPEYLGGTMFEINVNQVTSTAGYAAGTTTTVGETGAVSVTANKSTIFTKGFVEFGFVYVLISTVHDQSYCQGILREDTYEDRFDLYSPEFAHIGDQVIKNKEIMVTGTNDDEPFGYQEHWAEMTTFSNSATGLMDPNATGSLDYWTLANKFSSRPQLSETFIKENRSCLTRCLKTGSTGPDYIGSFFFDYTATREKELHSLPGLVDHVGNM